MKIMDNMFTGVGNVLEVAIKKSLHFFTYMLTLLSKNFTVCLLTKLHVHRKGEIEQHTMIKKVFLQNLVRSIIVYDLIMQLS